MNNGSPIELQDLPELNKKKVFTVKNSVLWIIGLIILGVTIISFIVSNYETLKGYKFRESLEALLVTIGLLGLYFSFRTLVSNHELNIRISKQNERHHQEIIAQNFKVHSELINQQEEFLRKDIEQRKKELANILISEWYVNFMHQSFIARNFRLAFREEPNGLNILRMSQAIEDLENEEVNLLKSQRDNIIRGEIEEPQTRSKFFIRKTLVPIFNYFEKIAICVDGKIVDEQLIKDYFEDLFLTYNECFQRLIEIRRRDYNGTKQAFQSFTDLVDRWEREQKR